MADPLTTLHPRPFHPLPARQLAAELARGALAPEALARATLARIAAEDGALGAFVCTLSADAAAAQARTLQGPLAGLPVAVKDIFDTRDLPTAYGSPIYPARPAMPMPPWWRCCAVPAAW